MTLGPKQRTRKRVLRTIEPLETRRVLSGLDMLPPPDPIEPTRGDANLLVRAQQHADADNQNALDHFPVPYAVTARSDQGEFVQNLKAGHPRRLDIDQRKDTGKGGKDLSIEVNTERPGTANDDWHLRATFERIDQRRLAQGIGVAVVFPFAAFNDETLPGDPNLFVGYEVGPGDAPPAWVDLRFFPHLLADGTHEFAVEIETIGSTSPVTFVVGHFDGDHDSGPLNASLFSIRVDQVPRHIRAEVAVGESQLAGATTESRFELDWTASAPTPVELQYLEGESPAALSAATVDFRTALTVDSMPASTHLQLASSETDGEVQLRSQANGPLGRFDVRKERSDGLVILATASDVPAEMQLGLRHAGQVTLDTSGNSLDLRLQAQQTGGFRNTQDLLGYDLGYLELQLADAPSLSAGYDADEKRFSAETLAEDTQIPLLELIVDDDARILENGETTGLELPPSYISADDMPPDARPHHLFSWVDDGEHGTAVARVVAGRRIVFDHGPGVRETLELQTIQAAPLQVHLRAGVHSELISVPAGTNQPDPYVDITCDVDDIPVGATTLTLTPPLGWSLQSATPIDSLGCFGSVGTLSFGVETSELPSRFGFDFRPEGSVELVAFDANGTPDDTSDDTPAAVRFLAAHVFDTNGFDPATLPLPSTGETFLPPGARLKDAKIRLDQVSSFTGSWHNETDQTVVEFDTDADAELDPANPLAYLEGLQLRVSTSLPAHPEIDLNSLPAATEQSAHYADFTDTDEEQTFAGGLFGLDRFRWATDDEGPQPSNFEVDWNLRPDRPFTPFALNVDVHPASSGALGAFFGNDEVNGSLDLGFLPSELQLTSKLDPEICTNGLFGFELPPELTPPIPSSIDLNLSVNDTLLLVHAEDVPAVFCMTWDTSNPTGVIEVLAEERDGSPAQAGLVEVLFQNDVSLPGDAAIFDDVENPLRELRIRLDEAPSFQGSWYMKTDDPNLVLSTVAESDEPFSILGGLRLTTSTEMGTQDLPVFPPLTGQEAHYFGFQDQGADKELEVGIFGMDEVGVFMRNEISTVSLDYLGDINRPLELQIASNDGVFFPDQNVDLAVVVDELPRQTAMVFTTTGDAFLLDASSGIESIQVGGPSLLGETGSDVATFDTTRSQLSLNGLPPSVRFANVANESLQFDVDGCSRFVPACDDQPATIASVVSHVWDDGEVGLDGEDPLFRDPMREIQIRFDEIPA